MANIAYDCHYGILGIDLFCEVTQDDLINLIEIARENGCNRIVQWIGSGECITLWTDD